ncbi:type II toxin-antitoxin system HicA family toxin [Anaerosalibacter massiliensis]|uniref:Type II toxin-antitoxin system HicA family toxin n=1 Tax=Anaerosalibacter massiliensis TaxID=1347392 RepID=A0A9X2MGB2_9FIRM|nr:type II toxin-antitoxin system HicA family toxin [Anaerosalibacter massiliensis]MCR2042687.1 type II toxin-antitoxin system HicA family toxin [Anaerosalibacter massiliensis]
MKNYKKFISFTLVFCIMLTSFSSFSFASEDDSTSDYIILEDGTKLTEDEFINYLETIDYAIKIDDSNGEIDINSNLYGNSNNGLMRAASVGIELPSAMASLLAGTWYIPGVGKVVLVAVGGGLAIYYGGKLITKGHKLYNSIVNFIKKKAKNSKPTGRKVKDVHQRLKKEGFKKVRQKGSHETWKKGKKTVQVPNHGKNHEIPIGTLRNIWKQAGWI